eukprot:scaffold2957_cov226-Isochrysis_galbana.AAC.2
MSCVVVEVVGTHAEATRVLVVVLGPREPHVAVVLVTVQREKERVSRVHNQHGRSPAAKAWRTGSALRESPGTRKRRPSFCTSVSVIGLSLAMSKERMEVKNRGCDRGTLRAARKGALVRGEGGR